MLLGGRESVWIWENASAEKNGSTFSRFLYGRYIFCAHLETGFVLCTTNGMLFMDDQWFMEDKAVENMALDDPPSVFRAAP